MTANPFDTGNGEIILHSSTGEIVRYASELEMQRDLNTEIGVYETPLEMVRDLYSVIDEFEANADMLRDEDPSLTKAEILERLRAQDAELVAEYDLTVEHLRRRGLGDVVA